MFDRLRVHESVPPLLRGLGSGLVLLAAVVGASGTNSALNARDSARAAVPQTLTATNLPAAQQSMEDLSHEVSQLRQAVQEESVAEEVLTNPWFEALGTAGSALIVVSFFADWLSKRPKPND